MISYLYIKVLYINQTIKPFKILLNKLKCNFWFCLLPRDRNLRFGEDFRCGEVDFCIWRVEHSGEKAKCAIAQEPDDKYYQVKGL